MARVDVPGALPKSIDIVNRGDVPTTTKHVDLTDAVTATAVYHTTKSGGDKLHITASSSDKTLAGTELTLPGFGNKALDATGQTDIATPAPPDTVTVESSKGGSVTVPVAIDGQGLDALPLLANAGPDQTVEQGAKVTLDGSGSAGDIDSVSWSGPSGVTLTGADNAKATFTAPSTAGSLTFTLTVKSGTTTKTDDVVINVKAANPASAQIAPVGATVLQNLPLTLDASSSVGAAKFEWSQVSTDATKVTLDGDTTSPKLTFLFPKTTTPIHIQVRVRSASDPGGTTCSAPTCDTAVITLTPQLDNLTNIRAKNDGKGRWVVDGNSSVLVSNNVRVYAGATIGTSANLIGTALVDPTGAWKVDVRNSQVAVPACRCVSVESDRGGRQLNVPVN
jgi:K319-like protein